MFLGVSGMYVICYYILPIFVPFIFYDNCNLYLVYQSYIFQMCVRMYNLSDVW